MKTAEHSGAAIAGATVVYLLFIAYQSLAGGAGLAICALPLVQQGAHLSFSDGIANLVAYVPLGMLVAARSGVRNGRVPAAAALITGFLAISAFSLAMETLQACLPGRVSSWYDWATNSAGGMAGLLAWTLGQRLMRVIAHRGVRGRRSASSLFWPALLCLGAWLALYTAPWRFTFDVGTLRANLSFLGHLSEGLRIDPWRLARH
ncbi:MAG: VanZ family protein, partial [Gammaproteobacteria bacterium]